MIPYGGTFVRPGVIAWDGVVASGALPAPRRSYSSCELVEQAIVGVRGAGILDDTAGTSGPAGIPRHLAVRPLDRAIRPPSVLPARIPMIVRTNQCWSPDLYARLRRARGRRARRPRSVRYPGACRSPSDCRCPCDERGKWHCHRTPASRRLGARIPNSAKLKSCDAAMRLGITPAIRCGLSYRGARGFGGLG